ncbi:MAG: hypothetical protein Q9195_009292 [Heterodermia aff. obscurata]
MSVTVRRFFGSRQESPLSPLRPTTSTANGFGLFRILLVIARKFIHENDSFDYVSPTSVLCSILNAQQELEWRFSPNRIQLEVVRPGTFEEFKASLLRCERKGKHHAFQIVHFDVHGDISASNHTAYLEFNKYDPNNPNNQKLQSMKFSPQEIAEQLLQHKIDCVVLSSCKTAVADAGVEANLSGNLLRLGVASVVAMSYKIPDSMSEIFFGRFYQELFVDGREVAHAVAVARKELRQNQGRWSYENERLVNLQDWFVPKYYSNGPAIYMGQWWTKLRGRKILKSIGDDRKNILRLEGDLQRHHKVFLNAWDDVEGTASILVTALSEIWRRTHLMQHRIVIQAGWFIHPLDVDIQDWRILLASCAHLLRLWMLESSPGLQCIARADGSDEESAEPRTIVIIDNINALFPEDVHRKAYHGLAEKRFYDWIERYFGTELNANINQNSHYLILIGNFVQETVKEWFGETLGTSPVLASSMLTEYINPKNFPHRTEGIATGRSWRG